MQELPWPGGNSWQFASHSRTALRKGSSHLNAVDGREPRRLFHQPANIQQKLAWLIEMHRTDIFHESIS